MFSSPGGRGGPANPGRVNARGTMLVEADYAQINVHDPLLGQQGSFAVVGDGNAGAANAGFVNSILWGYTGQDANNGWPFYCSVYIRGTPAQPLYAKSGDYMAQFFASSYSGANDGAGFIWKASEDHSATNQGAYVTINTIANGTNFNVERVRIDERGSMYLGSPIGSFQIDGAYGVFAQTSDLADNRWAQIISLYGNVGSNFPAVAWAMTRGANPTAHISCVAGDQLGMDWYYGSEGTTYKNAATFSCIVESTPSAGVVAGAFVWSTSADSSAPSERFRIGSTGTITAPGDFTYLGTPKTPGVSIIVKDNYFLEEFTRMTLSSSKRVTLQGTADLIIRDIANYVGAPKIPPSNFTVQDGYIHTINGRLTMNGNVRAILQGFSDLLLSDYLGVRSRITLSGQGS